MKIDFNFLLLDLDDKPVTDQHGEPVKMNKFLANCLANVQKGTEAAKFFDWSMQLWKTGSIDLDKAGQVEFEKAITNLEGPSVLLKGRALENLHNMQKNSETNGKEKK
jgi:hypothetical protein